MYVNIHTHGRTGTGIEVVSLAATAGLRSLYPAPPFSIGIHPWSASGSNATGPNFEAALREVGAAPATAIGEIGLDYAVEEIDSDGPKGSGGSVRELQHRIFEAQLEIAAHRDLPVILHCVKAFEPMAEILARFEGRLRAVIFHGFVGSAEQAALAAAKGWFLSFGMRSFASRRTVEAMRGLPLERMFLENDDAPTPIAEIYRLAAEATGVSVDDLDKRLNYSYLQVFQDDPVVA